MSILGALGVIPNKITNLRASLRGALHVRTPGLRYYGQTNRTVSTTGVQLTNIPQGTTVISIRVVVAPIFWTLDPTLTPSATVGDPASVGDTIWLEGLTQIRDFTALRDGGTDSRLQINCFVEGDYDA